jgi:hypothetical protein
MPRRSLRTRLLSFVFFGSAAIGPVGAAGPAPRFDWPDGLVMDVSIRIDGSRTDGTAVTASWDVQGTSRWSVRRDGGRSFIERPAFGGWEGKQPPSGGVLPFRLVEFVPRLVVGRDGSFFGVEGIDAERARIVAAFPELRAGDPMIKALVEASTRDEGLRAVAEDFWTTFVGLWLMAGAEVHDGYAFANRARVPQLGGGELDIRGVASLESMSDCVRGGVKRRCATLRFVSSVDQDQFKALAQKLVDTAGGPELRWLAFDQRKELTVIAELDTLIPHRATIRSESLMEVEYEGQRDKRLETTKKEYRFEHVAPVAPAGTSAN